MSLVDVIIPTYRPDKKFLISVKRLLAQTVHIDNIIIINTDKDVWDRLGIEKRLRALFEETDTGLILGHIGKREFDHGACRNKGVEMSASKYFVCMTQDAVCFDQKTIEYLLRGMDKSVKLTYARQLPNVGADNIERFTREFNYPAESVIKSFNERNTLGIKTYFSSNVCAAYERETFDALGRFDEGQILNEDMLYAYRLITNGYFIKYEAWAKVLHSHHYSGWQQFRRNFDIGVSQASNEHIFKNINSEKEGKKLVSDTVRYLQKKHSYMEIVKLIYISGCKYMGFLLGKNFKRLPKSVVKRFSCNRSFWE